jgi:hypothetical protein
MGFCENRILEISCYFGKKSGFLKENWLHVFLLEKNVLKKVKSHRFRKVFLKRNLFGKFFEKNILEVPLLDQAVLMSGRDDFTLTMWLIYKTKPK